jgi:hypothetical protein
MQASSFFGSKATVQPLGGDPMRSMSRAGAVPVLLTTRLIGVASPATALALRRSSLAASFSCGSPAICRVQRRFGAGILRR